MEVLTHSHYVINNCFTSKFLGQNQNTGILDELRDITLMSQKNHKVPKPNPRKQTC